MERLNFYIILNFQINLILFYFIFTLHLFLLSVCLSLSLYPLGFLPFTQKSCFLPTFCCECKVKKSNNFVLSTLRTLLGHPVQKIDFFGVIKKSSYIPQLKCLFCFQISGTPWEPHNMQQKIPPKFGKKGCVEVISEGFYFNIQK